MSCMPLLTIHIMNIAHFTIILKIKIHVREKQSIEIVVEYLFLEIIACKTFIFLDKYF
jgi:hypothetical protein